MRNKFFKRVAIAFAAATIALTGAAVSVSANDGMGVDSMNITVSEAFGPAYIISGVGANVRVSPSTDSRIQNTLSFGDRVEMTGYTSNGWYQVFTEDKTYGGRGTGYIWGELVSTKQPAGEKAPAYTAADADQSWITFTNSANSSRIKEYRGEMSHDNDTFTVSVASGFLALRSAAYSSSDNIIGELYNGQMVHVQSYGSQFDYVYAPSLDMYGFVNNDYLIG